MGTLGLNAGVRGHIEGGRSEWWSMTVVYCYSQHSLSKSIPTECYMVAFVTGSVLRCSLERLRGMFVITQWGDV